MDIGCPSVIKNNKYIYSIQYYFFSNIFHYDMKMKERTKIIAREITDRKISRTLLRKQTRHRFGMRRRKKRNGRKNKNN